MDEDAAFDVAMASEVITRSSGQSPRLAARSGYVQTT